MTSEADHTHPLALGADLLAIEDVVSVARAARAVVPLPDDPLPGTELAVRAARVEASADWVRRTLDEIEAADADGRDPLVIYGVNTGYGDNADRAVFRKRADAARLSRNLVLSHAVGAGDALPPDAARAAMLIRVNTLAQGYSGVRKCVINTLAGMLNRGVLPVMPQQGSLGASGDLAPLAHLALVLSAPAPGEADHPGASGQAWFGGVLLSGAEAMAAAGLERVVLSAKEGVALVNGTAVSAGIAALTYHDAAILLDTAQIALALSVEALKGFRDAFLPHTHAIRGHAGQQQVAARVRGLTDGSTLVRGGAGVDLDPAAGPPQDPYSLRAAPAVLGAVADTLRHVEGVLTTEINAVTDNPLIFVDEDGPLHLDRLNKAVSGANFHGAPVGYVMDFLKIAVADLASISERRSELLLDGRLNRGLPPFLIDEPRGGEGLNNGLMMPQYTAAALVSENKVLSHPASVDSIPSSANREDHVSMSTIAARHAAQVVANAQMVVAIELLCAFQAVELRLRLEPGARLGAGTAAAMDTLRAVEIAPGVPLRMITRDEALKPALDALLGVVRRGTLVEAVS